MGDRAYHSAASRHCATPCMKRRHFTVLSVFFLATTKLQAHRHKRQPLPLLAAIATPSHAACLPNARYDAVRHPAPTALVPKQGTCLGSSPCSLSRWERSRVRGFQAVHTSAKPLIPRPLLRGEGLQAQGQRCRRACADKVVEIWVTNCQTCRSCAVGYLDPRRRRSADTRFQPPPAHVGVAYYLHMFRKRSLLAGRR